MSKVMTWLDVQSHRIVYQYQDADCVMSQFHRWNLSTIILLAWTLGHITNLIMKTGSASGAFVDLKKCRHLLARVDIWWCISNVEIWENASNRVLYWCVNRYASAFPVCSFNVFVSFFEGCSRGTCICELYLVWIVNSWRFEDTFF
jgi:hypothetical protein